MSKLTKPFKPNKKPKPKVCVTCKKEFTPLKIGQVACSPKCAIDYINSPENKIKEKISRELAKKERAENKKKKDALKTRSEHLKEAQAIVNSFIRERDKNEPCISCGTMKTGIQFHAGHYRTVGAHPELRFNEINIHKQCSACNNHKSGNIVEYRINLVKKIGADKVEWLEGHHDPKKYTIEEIKQIKSEYRAKLKYLQAQG